MESDRVPDVYVGDIWDQLVEDYPDHNTDPAGTVYLALRRMGAAFIILHEAKVPMEKVLEMFAQLRSMLRMAANELDSEDIDIPMVIGPEDFEA